MIAAATDILGVVSGLFFLLDWVIISSLLLHHCLSMSAVAAASSSSSDCAKIVST
jgi:hypothetical protein